MKYIVYQTTNKINGKLYIGVHKTKDPDKFDGYIGNGIYIGNKLQNPKTVYQHALKKYGYDSFIRTTLKVFNNEKEAYDLESNIVTLDFIRQDNNYNTRTGGLHGAWNYKIVYQFDYNGNLIKKWDSVSEIIEYYSCNTARIRMAIQNKYSAFESYWNYENSINIAEYRKSKLSEVYQFDFYGNIIQIYKSVPEICDKLGYSNNSLQEAISKKKNYKNYYWTKDPDNIFEIIKLNKLFNLNNKAVIQYDINMNVIKEYYSAKIASKELNIKYGTIASAIAKHSLVQNKFYFSYYSNISKKKKIAQYDFDTKKLVKIWDSITECAKIHPKCRDVLKGVRNHTHGYTFEYIDED